MSEPKPLASLNASLLARKGDARPAIGRSHLQFAPLSRPSRADAQDSVSWDQIGDSQDSPARRQIARIEHRYSKDRRAAPAKAKAAFTLRLDSDRHLRLRLASAVSKRSAQQIVTEALDAFLDNHPHLEALVDQAKKAKGK